MKIDITNQVKDEFLISLKTLISYPSVLNEGENGTPFGQAIQDVLEKTLEICRDIGFTTYLDPKGYYGYAEIGQGAELLAILCHLDVVPSGDEADWQTPPFEATIKDGWVFGRGVQDDKGPSLAALYAVKSLLDQGIQFKKRVRFIFGTDEETLWRCMARYNTIEEQASMGFAPDSSFPLTYAEKGLLQVKLHGPGSDQPQLFTPNLRTIQNPCLSLDPGWFLFSPNGCFLLDKKEFPLYGISVEKNTKRKETHMNSLPNHHFQNKSFYQLSFDGGHLTQYGGLIFFQELFSQLKLKERISKYLVTNDQRRYCRYSDSDILVQFLFQLLTGYGTDYACKELSADAYFPKLLEGGQLASQPTLSRFLSRTDEETVRSLRCLNLELVEFFLQFHQLNQLIVDIDSTHFTTYGKQEGVAYNAHYRAHGYHPLYAFEGKTGYCFNAQLRPGNRYCSEEADSFITPVLERFNQLLFRMDSGFATPKLYDLIEKTGQYYLIKLKKNTVLSRLGDLSLPCPQDEDLTILPHSAYSETLYQAGSWSHKRRVCQFSERKEGNLFYDVISLVTNMTSGTSQDQFQLYRGRGQAENFIKEMKEGFFGDKTDSSSLIKNEVRMMMSCIAYNLYLFLKHLAGGDFQTLTIKRFRHLFLHVVGKCVRTGRKQLLKLSSLYAYSELFSALYSRIRKVNLNLPVPYEPPGRKASLMMH